MQITQNFRALGHEQITGLNTAKSLTIPTTHPKTGERISPKAVRLRPTTQGVRYRADGTDPTSSIGIAITAGVTDEYVGDLSSLRFIEMAASAVLDVEYLG